MLSDFLEGAAKISQLVITDFRVAVKDQRSVAVSSIQSCVRTNTGNRFLLIALICMFMNLLSADRVIFHCKCRKNQSVCSAKYHNSCHNCNNFMPISSAFSLFISSYGFAQ